MEIVESLTGRERQVLRLVATGRSTKQIAFELGITFKTACCHRARIMGKLDAHNTAALIRNAIQGGLVQIHSGVSLTPRGEERHQALLSRMTATLEEQRRDRQILSSEIEQSRALRAELRYTRAQLRLAVSDLKAQTEELVANANGMEYRAPVLPAKLAS
jgi:DNA-binding CsgD family transcriptional regulator